MTNTYNKWHFIHAYIYPHKTLGRRRRLGLIFYVFSKMAPKHISDDEWDDHNDDDVDDYAV